MTARKSEAEGLERLGPLAGIAERWDAAYPRDTGREPIVIEPGRHLAAFQGGMDHHQRDLIAGMIVVFVPGNDNRQPICREVGPVLDGWQPCSKPVVGSGRRAVVAVVADVGNQETNSWQFSSVDVVDKCPRGR